MNKKVQILKQKNKEANQFIIGIAKMLNIETDGIGYDDIQLSLDDFENAIRVLEKPSSVPHANELLPHVSGSSLFVIELSDEELKIVTKKELDEMYESAIEFDGFLGFSVKGRLV